MKPIYYFEEELLKTHNFEPEQEGYCIDELAKEDRAMLGGILYALYACLPAWKEKCEAQIEEASVVPAVGNIAKEYLNSLHKELEAVFVSSVQDFAVNCLDALEEEGVERDGNDKQ